MTNQLFRDYLDGRIKVRTQDDRLREAATKAAQATGLAVTEMIDMFNRVAEAVKLTAHQVQMLGRALGVTEPAPADPRERALWAKNQRGTGPKLDPLRTRGRTNRYKEKH